MPKIKLRKQSVTRRAKLPPLPTRSSLTTFGGKGKMLRKLFSVFPKHGSFKTFIDVFGGAGWVIAGMPPSPVEVWNDVNENLYTFFKVLRDPKTRDLFVDKCSFTPYSRRVYEEIAAQDWEAWEPVERAWAFFVLCRQGFGGKATTDSHTWGYAVTESCRGMSNATSQYLGAITNLLPLAARLRMVEMECRPWEYILEKYDRGFTYRSNGELKTGSFFYLDPPYYPSKRDGSTKFRSEMSRKDHRRLVKACLRLEGMAVLSGYANPAYKPLEEAGWERISWDVVCHLTGRTKGSEFQGLGSLTESQKRVECVWVSPNIPPELRGLL